MTVVFIGLLLAASTGIIGASVVLLEDAIKDSCYDACKILKTTCRGYIMCHRNLGNFDSSLYYAGAYGR